MNESDRNTESVLLRLQETGGCDPSESCSCTLHLLLLRLLNEYKRKREEEIRREAQKQIDYNNLKIELDIE